jgi:hypothetical protein
MISIAKQQFDVLHRQLLLQLEYTNWNKWKQQLKGAVLQNLQPLPQPCILKNLVLKKALLQGGGSPLMPPLPILQQL